MAKRSPAEKYEQLGLADALSRPYDYSYACEELALILRRAYAKLPKNVQSLIFRDTLAAFHFLPKIEPSIGMPAVNVLAQAAEFALSRKKKTLAFSELKHVMVAQKRRGKAHEHAGRSVWRSRPHLAVCVHCETIIWLSGITCNMHHRCPKNQQWSFKIRPISAYTLIDYLLGKFKCDCYGKNFDWSSSETDDSDNEGLPGTPWHLSKLWALPRLVENL